MFYHEKARNVLMRYEQCEVNLCLFKLDLGPTASAYSNTCPGVTEKYSGAAFAGISAEALLAVTTAVLSMVIHSANVLVMRICRVWLPNGVVNWVALV
jgi:hypothetical protein